MINNKHDENIDSIFVAVSFGRDDVFKSLIDKVNINCLDEDKVSLLQAAIAHRNYKYCSKLLEKGIDVNNEDNKGQTALHYLPEYNADLQLVSSILENGASLDIEDDYGNQPLWVAVFNAKGEYELVKLFLEYGADPNHKNKNNKSPLDFAKQIGDEELIKILDQ